MIRLVGMAPLLFPVFADRVEEGNKDAFVHELVYEPDCFFEHSGVGWERDSGYGEQLVADDGGKIHLSASVGHDIRIQQLPP